MPGRSSRVRGRGRLGDRSDLKLQKGWLVKDVWDQRGTLGLLNTLKVSKVLEEWNSFGQKAKQKDKHRVPQQVSAWEGGIVMSCPAFGPSRKIGQSTDLLKLLKHVEQLEGTFNHGAFDGVDRLTLLKSLGS